MRMIRFAVVVWVTVMIAIAGCGGGDATSTFEPDGSVGGQGDGGRDSGSFGGGDLDGSGGTCAPKTCAQLGFDCGPQGDGCGGLLQCGSCPADQFCGGGGSSKCGSGVVPDGGLCSPKSCADLGAQCGQQGDGCGRVIDCGTCAAPAYCGGGGTNRCGLGGPDGGTACVPTTCPQLGAGCGVQGNGCGGMLDCGTCTAPAFCGGKGANQCGLGSTDGGSLCVPKTCAQLGATCGAQGDGCGGTLACGTCASPAYCGGNGANKCGLGGADGGSACVPKTCAQLGATCGTQGDGCGGTVSCGACTAPAYCGGAGANHCGQGGADGGSACVPKTCAQLGATCGAQGDGCGGTLSCGTCTAPAYCGGNGANTCGLGGSDGGSTCAPKTCAQLGAACGAQGDGCGGMLSCGTCTAPAYCGGNGPNQCGQGGADGGSACVPKTCAQLGATCGSQGDGCGGTLSCGTCTAPAYCGGNGANKCGLGGADGGSSCVPKTCVQLGATCGSQGDGCGGTLSCGTCTAPAYCGGNGANKCGLGGTDGGSACVPKTCAQLGANCGSQGDGCGGTLTCGTCTAPSYCGGAGPNVCGQGGSDGGPVCISKTCAQLGVDCGPVGDGCGGLIASCGTCVAPQFCGASTPSKCGIGTIPTDAGTYVTCDGGGVTSISGTVLAGTDPTLGFGQPDPIYNAYVYVPSGPVQAITTGATCDQCSSPQSSIVSAITGVDGKFTLINPPVGTAVPVVIQLGKWRRVLSVNVQACQANVLTAADTHLPRNRTEGNIPRFAIDTGDVDVLECVLRKMGIQDSEFTNPSLTAGVPQSAGRVHVYQANPSSNGAGGAVITNGTPREGSLIGSQTTLNSYDIVLFPCEGGRDDESAANQARVINYANAGGRIFATHFSYVWLYNDAPFSDTASWQVDQGSYAGPLTGIVDTSFPKGQALSDWLALVGASTAAGRIPVNVVRKDFNSVTAPSQRWMYTQAPDPAMPIHYTFNAPVGAASNLQCGRVVFSDFHVENSAGAKDVVFPTECAANAPLTPQEKLLEFMLFDLSSCISTDVPTCTPKTCTQLGATCGSQGDGCGGTLSCGTCTAPDTCGGAGTPSQCGHTTCTPQTCASQGISCGPAGNGCGGSLACGTCASNQTCGGGGSPGVCGIGSCNPLTCAQQGIQCGAAGNGCGGQLSCGACALPDTCGGAGTPGVCGHVTCVPRTCGQAGVSCGPAGDGCGGTLQCGACTGVDTCGGAGTPGQCGHPTCAPRTCASQNIACGPAGDGCGGSLDCGVCTLPNTCGGGGTPGQCGTGTCAPRTCASQNISCGTAGDGCGGALDCGACTGLDTCGGGGVPGKCGHPTCAPVSCAAQSISCGPAGDGCGGALNCGVCALPSTCGGGGTPGQCGTGTCTKQTCAQQNVACGPAGDGCGGTLACGSCAPPDTCGGGGTTGQCGHPPCTPITCAQQGVTCGPAGDGCGGTLACGPCVLPTTCGGGGTPGTCGIGGCTVRTCAQQNVSCGPAGDGCGGALDCGACAAPDTCGGGGTPGKCGHPSCPALTCQSQGIQCGPAGDGCGNLIQCGPCTPPDTCGGGGAPGTCGRAVCTPQTCQSQNIQCGPAGDGCGGAIDCGSCVAPQTCGGGGKAGVCGGTGAPR
jgi:hypothetical protein